MTNAYPLPRQTRETDILAGDGRATYGPFAFRIWDAADATAVVSRQNAEFLPEPIVAAKTSDDRFAFFTATFAPALVPGDRYVVRSSRLHERLGDVTRGGSIAGAELERELSVQGTVLQELRRDETRNEAEIVRERFDRLTEVAAERVSRIAGDRVEREARVAAIEQEHEERVEADLRERHERQGADEAERGERIEADRLERLKREETDRFLHGLIGDFYGADAVDPINVSSIAAAKLLSIEPAASYLRLGGRNLAGDGEGGLFVASNNGSTDSFQTEDGRNWYRATSEGPIATQSQAEIQRPELAPEIPHVNVLRMLQAIRASIRNHGHLTPMLFGARGDGVTDDRAAVQAALDADEGYSVFLNKRFRIAAAPSNSAALIWSRPKHVFGTGMFAFGGELLFDANLPADMDWVRLAPLDAERGIRLFGWSWLGTIMRGAAGTPGRYGFSIRLIDAADTSFLAKFAFLDNWIFSPGHNAFRFEKQGAVNTGTFNGLFASEISRNRMDSGPNADAVLKLVNSGDSLTAEDNTLTGFGVGIRTLPVVGAAMQVFAKNNITASGGALNIEGGQQVKFMFNQCELIKAMDGTGNPDSLILINGSANEITGNNLGAKSFGHCIRINSGQSNLIDGVNTMQADVAGGKHHLVIGAAAGGHNILTSTNRFLNSPNGIYGPGSISDASVVAQIGPWKSLNTFNGWAAHSDANFYQGLFYKLDESRRVTLRGTLAGGTPTAGLNIAQLPNGARPFKAQRFKAGQPGGVAQFLIATDGAIRIEETIANPSRVSFDDVVINLF